MSEIIMGEGTDVPIYMALFKKVLHDVLGIIKESDDEVTWIVCNEKDLPSKDISIDLVAKGKEFLKIHKYGRCDYREKKVWISTQAILESGLHTTTKTMVEKYINFNNATQIDRLTDVILDELAHIKTGCNHGDAKYESLLKKYKERYRNK